MKKLVVCFVTHEFNFFMMHKFDLVSEIVKLHEVVILTDLKDAKENDLIKVRSKNIKLKHIQKRSSSNVFDYARYVYELKASIKKIKPTHIFYVTLEVSFLGSIINDFKAVKKSFFIITGIGQLFFTNDFKHMILRFFYLFIFKINLLKKNYLFIFQNDDDQNVFLKKVFIKKIKSKVIRGFGVKLNTNDKSYDRSQITFFFAGRLAKSKGIEELLDAGKYLEKKYSNFKLLIAGSYFSDEHDYFSKSFYESLKEYNFIEYIGNVDHSKMNHLYEMADIFVLPSYREGLSKAVLEAASNGMPLIVSDTPGCKECIDNNGLLVRPKDSKDLAEKMEYFIKNPELIEKYSKNSQSHIKRHFSLDIIASEYIGLIN